MPCAIYTCKRPGRLLVKVGSASSGDCFNLKGAEWADVKTGSIDANVRVQARKRPKYAAIAARASTSFSAPDLELTDDAGSYVKQPSLTRHRPARPNPHTPLITTEQPGC